MKKWRQLSVRAKAVVLVVVASLVVGAIFLGIALTGDSGGTHITDSPTPSGGEGQAPEIDWSNPASGVLVNSINEAKDELPFDVHVPIGLGDPRIYVRARSGEEAEDRVVAFVYQTHDGMVFVEEHLPYVSATEFSRWEKAVVSPPKVGEVKHGHAKLVTVRGQEALLTYSDDSTLLFWIEGGVEFVLGGPNLSPDHAVSLAEAL